MFAVHWREEARSRLGDGFDLVIVGGGITGCGVLMEAAQRGLSALLVEKGDVACGTSSRSSKLSGRDSRVSISWTTFRTSVTTWSRWYVSRLVRFSRSRSWRWMRARIWVVSPAPSGGAIVSTAG